MVSYAMTLEVTAEGKKQKVVSKVIHFHDSCLLLCSHMDQKSDVRERNSPANAVPETIFSFTSADRKLFLS